MNLPNAIKQAFLGSAFVPTNNAGYLNGAPYPPYRPAPTVLPGVLLLDYKGPHASDKQTPHDIQVRVHGNMGRKTLPVSVRAEQWIDRHPQVYAMFRAYALKAIASGRRRYSAKAIIEFMRWNEEVEGGRDFKLPNAVTAYLAKRFVREHPEHASLFLMAKKGGAR